MKMKRKILIPLLLSLAMLTGCRASNEAAQPASVAQMEVKGVLNAQSIPETTAPETTVPETEAAAEQAAPFEVTIFPVTTQPQKQVTVNTVDEFLAAIASDTEIILNAPMFDLSEATGYGKVNGSSYNWDEGYDGPEMVFRNVSNLTIRGSGEDHNANVISSVPRYAYVLTFENCSNIHVAGFTAGHTKEPGSCRGGVLCFRNSQDILVEDCGLFGCGTLGVMAESSKNIQVINCDIYECSVGGVELTNCEDVNVDGCTFRDLGTPEWPGSEFRVYGCGKVTCNGEKVHDFNPRDMY